MSDLSKASCLFSPRQIAAANLPARAGKLPNVTIPVFEPYAPSAPPTTCGDRLPKPGVVAFRKFVLENLGGGDSGICRACIGPPKSEHNEGRAWDWRVMLNNPADVERVDTLFDWLLKDDPHGEPHANFRRLGLRYMIWNKEIFSAGSKTWKPYGGPGKSPHQDHVHFTFAHPGANAETSFFVWLDDQGAPRGDYAGPLFAIGAGLAVGWFGWGYLSKR